MSANYYDWIYKLALEIMGAKAIFILKKDGTWNNYGIPDIPMYKPEEFLKEHDNIPDDRQEAWWIK